jgi:tetratricopeptide (TPR) repeat protein
MGKYAKAKESLEKSQLLYEELGAKQKVAAINETWGDYFFKQQQYPEAIQYYLKAIKMAEIVQDKKTIAEAYFNLVACYKKIKKKQEATEAQAHYESLRVELSMPPFKERMATEKANEKAAHERQKQKK